MLSPPGLTVIAIAVGLLLLIAVAKSIGNRVTRRREEVQRRRDLLARERSAAVKRQHEEPARQKRQKAEQLVAAKRKEEEQARLEDGRRVAELGKHGAAFVKRAQSSVQQIVSSEAARDGWLGDVEFAPDIDTIEANVLEARAFRRKTDELSALPKPNDNDRKIIAEAKTTIAQLERKAKERVELLERCAREANLIDESLRREREEARIAAKREELHGQLAAMLYGVEAAGAVPAESAADAVMARVLAYQDIRGKIERARDDAEAPADAETEIAAGSATTRILAPIRDAWKWIVD